MLGRVEGMQADKYNRYTLKEWCEEIVREAEAGNLRTGPKDSFWDQIFENEMNELVEATKANYDG